MKQVHVYLIYFISKKTFTVKVSWIWLCSFISLPSLPRLVSCVDIALTCPFLFLYKERLHKEAMPE